MTSWHARIAVDGRKGTVEVGEADLSGATVAGELLFDSLNTPTLRLELSLTSAEVDGEVRTVVPAATARALVALGWTPPAGDGA